MKNLKTTIFSVTLLGTTFVALGYFCEKCRTNHEWLGECIGFGRDGERNVAQDKARYENCVTSIVKDSIRHCHSCDNANAVIGKLRRLLEIKEFQRKYRDLWDIGFDEKWLRAFGEFLDDMDGRIKNYKNSHNENVINWEEVFGDSKFTLSSPDNENDHVFENENDPWR